MLNILTIDVEDWYHPTLTGIDCPDDSLKGKDRVVNNTLKILDLLEQTKNFATFFILGEVAEKYPELVKEIAEKGHEVGSHGYRHNLVYNSTKQKFDADIKKSVEILEGITNQKIIGYRAPSWSLNEKTSWAWEVLHTFGFKYDSSLYPYKTFLFGNNNYPRFTYDIETGENFNLKEIPPSVIEIFKKRLPFSGGFFFRVSPYWYIKWCINQYKKAGMPTVIYIHPWELDMNTPCLSVGFRERLLLYVNKKNTEKKLYRLLNEYKFTSLKEYFRL